MKKFLYLLLVLIVSYPFLCSANIDELDQEHAEDRGFHQAGSSTQRRIREEINEGTICSDFKVKVGGLGIFKKEIFYFDDVIAQNRTGISNLSYECLSNFLDEYITFKNDREREHPNTECNTDNCPFFSSMYAHYQSNLIYLRQKIAEKTPERAQRECLSVTQVQAEPIEEDETVQESLSILQWLDQYGDTLPEDGQLDESPDNRWCAEFRVGESRVVNKSSFGSPTGVEMRYALTRDSRTDYTADVVIDFKRNGSSQYNDQQILERTRECVRTVSSQFYTDSGERMRINIHSPEQSQSLPANRRAPPVEITYGNGPTNTSQPGHSRNYPDDFDCATITHEVLHLMGLHDEYDPTRKDHLVSGCRPVSKTASIMVNHTSTALHQLGFNEPTGINSDNHRRIRSCTCDDDNQNCKLIVQKNDSNLNLFKWAEFSKAMANRLGMSCQEILAGNPPPVPVTANSSVPEPRITTRNGVTSITTYSFEESENDSILGYLSQKNYQCSCETSECRNRNSSQLKIEDFYWIEVGRCPEGSRNMFSEWIRRPASGDRSFSDGIYSTDERPFSFNLQVDREFDGLRDYQFKRIKHGNCISKSVTYSRCARIGGFDVAPSCSETPPECRVPDVLLTDD